MDPRDIATFADTDLTSSDAGPQRRRILVYLVGLLTIVVLYALAYQASLSLFEGRQVSFPKALLTVVESFTTTGYGEDSDLWTTTPVQLLLISMQLTGVALIFLALPVFLAPWVEEQLSQTAPTSVDDLSEHVVLAGFSSRGEALVDELEARGRPYVIVEPDRDRANELYAETEMPVIHGDPKLTRTLRATNADLAQAVVADIDDQANASIALAAGALDDEVVEDYDLAAYHQYAGADAVFSPRHLIGESIAHKVSAGIRPEPDESVQLDEDFDIAEFPVHSGSELVGVTVAESGVRERTGANIIGAWFRGEFVSPPPPDASIDGQTILVAAGREPQLEQLKELTRSHARGVGADGSRVVLAGYDEVGSTTRRELDPAVPTTVIDLEEKEGVDVVGDVTDAETLERADMGTAGTIIITVSSDTTTVFATLVIRELYPDVEIIARADATESVRKLYQAGADYVLAVATVAGRMLASTILEEDIVSFDQQVEIVRMDAGALAGQSLAEADVRARTGVTVIAVERGAEFRSDIGPEFVVEPGDSLIVAGIDRDVNRFSTLVES
ncbi:metal transporter [Halobacteriales archaeon QS_4_70_19]|nr:MAG: metal transporter [Halobacteriales archaeon QS_4_70_19]